MHKVIWCPPHSILAFSIITVCCLYHFSKYEWSQAETEAMN
uniref:Uncharacterized protein n=1 Tax=Rhizophora mucronata TaxID=61149 RepID=A0A2P2Q432_RHIMU